MNESYLFDTTFNNIIFASRNKAYGAYQLRHLYNKHVVTATIAATGVFGISLAAPLLLARQGMAENKATAIPKNQEPIIFEFPLPPPAEPIKETVAPVAPAEQQKKTVRNTTPKVVPDAHPGPDEAPPKQEDMADAIFGTQNKDGELASAIDLSGLEGTEGGTGSGQENEAASSVFDFAEEMPSFEGGDAALMKYISKRIRYPRQAVDEKIEGTVVVTFVVSRSGKVTEVTVLKGLGFGMDEEASRVIRNMPAWNPGKQNGAPVAVRYTLPIRFSLQR